MFDVVEAPDAPSQDKGGAPRRMVAAASRVKGVLVGELELRGSRATALVRVGEHQALPKGTKLIGQARSDGEGVVEIRFRTAVLPDGTQLRIEAEAQTESGTTGLVGIMSGEMAEDDGSVAGDVADGTAGRLVRGTLGSGLVGGAVDDAMRSSDRRRPRRAAARPVVSLPQGTVVYAFFLEEATR